MSVLFSVRLYDQLHELESKRNSLQEEARMRGTPAEERERLLKQVTLPVWWIHTEQMISVIDLA